MFAKAIVLSDAFLDMPMSARCLYFTLSMTADDDGFVGNPKAIMRQCGASQDDLLMLLQKRFILGFESGVIVIKHWRLNNYLKNDRHKTTTYVEEMKALMLDSKGAYTENVSTPENNWRTTGEQVETQDRLGKDRIDKDRIEDSTVNDINKKYIISTDQLVSRPQKHKHGEYKNVLLTDEELEKLKTEFPDYQERIERLSSYIASTGKSYKSHLATIRNWARMDKDRQKNTPINDSNHFDDLNEWVQEVWKK